MQEMGLEPTRPCGHRHLKPARLPIPPLLQFSSTRFILYVAAFEVKDEIFRFYAFFARETFRFYAFSTRLTLRFYATTLTITQF